MHFQHKCFSAFILNFGFVVCNACAGPDRDEQIVSHNHTVVIRALYKDLINIAIII